MLRRDVRLLSNNFGHQREGRLPGTIQVSRATGMHLIQICMNAAHRRNCISTQSSPSLVDPGARTVSERVMAGDDYVVHQMLKFAVLKLYMGDDHTALPARCAGCQQRQEVLGTDARLKRRTCRF